MKIVQQTSAWLLKILEFLTNSIKNVIKFREILRVLQSEPSINLKHFESQMGPDQSTILGGTIKTTSFYFLVHCAEVWLQIVF